MMVLLLIVLTIGICVLLIWINQLDRKIAKLEIRIGSMQYQIDDILCDINIVNQNILNTYGMLGEIKNEYENR